MEVTTSFRFLSKINFSIRLVGSSALIACRKIAERIKGKNVVLQMSGANESADRYLLALNNYLSAK